MHLFVAPDAVTGDRAHVEGDDAHHLVRVLRAGPGHEVTLADGSGIVYSGRVAAVGPRVAVEIVDVTEVPAPTPRIHVVHALPKGRKLDEVVQRLTELGVDRITPVHSRRSQVRLDATRAERAHRRWSAVAHAAAKQSRRAWLPVIDPVSDWSAHHWDAPGVVLWEQAATPLRSALAGAATDAPTVTVAVGPEGGLTDEEVDETGLAPATLGGTILRTEFASVAGVVALMTLLGRFA